MRSASRCRSGPACSCCSRYLTIAVPSTPGQVGALEAGVLAATRLLHIDDAPAFAFALLYHVLQILPLLVVALITEAPLMLMRPPEAE